MTAQEFDRFAPGGAMSDEEDPALIGEIRVGDAERDEVVSRLREASGAGQLTLSEFEARSAIAYHARVRSELVPLLDDLPTELPVVPPARTATPGPRSSKWVMGLFGAGRQQGHFRPATTTNAVAVGANTRLDLTEAELIDDEMVIRAFALFGHVDVIVPEYVETDMAGLAIFGSRSHRPKGPTPPGAPRVVVKAYAVCGIVNVRNRRRLRRFPRRTKTTGHAPQPDPVKTRRSLRSRLPALPSGEPDN